MGFDFGAFAGGIGSGIEQGQEIRKKHEDAAARQMAKLADQNYSKWLEQAKSGTVGGAKPGMGPTPQLGPKPGMGQPPLGGPPPGMGASPPMGPKPGMGGPPPPQGMPPGGAPPGPPQGQPPGGPTPVPMPGARPMQPPQPMPGGPPAAPPPGPPQGGMGPKPGMGGPPPGGAPPGMGAPGGGITPPTPNAANDILEQSKSAVQITAMQIAQAFPGKKWKPGELLATVDSVLQHTQSIDPIAKQIAQLQLQYYAKNLQADTSRANTQDRVGATERGQDLAHGDRQDSIAQRAQSADWQHMDRHERNQLYGEFVALNHEDRQAAIAGANQRNDNTNATRLEALDRAIEDRDWQTVAKLTAGADNAATGAASREYTADVNTGAKPARPVPVRSPLPARPGAGSRGDATPPPQAMQHLKEGQPTTFANGQTWTLKGGKPVRVK